jgi:hypothetical protein
MYGGTIWEKNLREPEQVRSRYALDWTKTTAFLDGMGEQHMDSIAFFQVPLFANPPSAVCFHCHGSIAEESSIEMRILDVSWP